MINPGVKKYDRVMQFLEEHDKPFSLEDAAKATGASKSYIGFIYRGKCVEWDTAPVDGKYIKFYCPPSVGRGEFAEFLAAKRAEAMA